MSLYSCLSWHLLSKKFVMPFISAFLALFNICMIIVLHICSCMYKLLRICLNNGFLSDKASTVVDSISFCILCV